MSVLKPTKTITENRKTNTRSVLVVKVWFVILRVTNASTVTTITSTTFQLYDIAKNNQRISEILFAQTLMLTWKIAIPWWKGKLKKSM